MFNLVGKHFSLRILNVCVFLKYRESLTSKNTTQYLLRITFGHHTTTTSVRFIYNPITE